MTIKVVIVHVQRGRDVDASRLVLFFVVVRALCFFFPWGALPDFVFLFSFSCSADHKRDWPTCKSHTLSSFFLCLFLWRCRFFRVFLYHCRFLFVWRERRTFSLSGWFFLPCDHGLDFFTSACVRIQSINQSEYFFRFGNQHAE